MKTFIIILTIITSFSLKANSQIHSINNYNELIEFQNNIKSKSAIVVVWGYFDSWGKYSDIHKFSCKGVLNLKDYAKITSCLKFKLFSDTTTYYLPIKEPNSLLVNYQSNDIIKLKIKLYKSCKIIDNKLFFLIEEVL